MSEQNTSLPSEDVSALFKMARDKSAAGRKALVNAVSDLFFNNTDVLSDREKAAFIQAAELVGMTLSAWLRLRLREAAERELQARGIAVQFLRPPVGLRRGPKTKVEK